MPDGHLFWSEQILAIDGKTDFKSEIYGYETKKLHKRKTSREIVNLISSEEKKKIQNLFLALGKVDYMRIDGRFNGNHFYLIELSQMQILARNLPWDLLFNHTDIHITICFIA